MGLSKRETKASIEDFCRQFYDSQIFCAKTGDKSGASPLCEKALRSVKEMDPSLAIVDRDLFRREITALHIELFGLAWLPYLAKQSESGEHQRRYENLLVRQIASTKAYLERHGHPDIWKMVLAYNKAGGDALGEGFVIDRFVKDWTKRGIDSECATVAAHRLRARFRDAMRQDLYTHLTAIFAERSGWDLRPNSDAFLQIQSFLSLAYDDASRHLQTRVIASTGKVTSRFHESAKTIGLGIALFIGACWFWYSLGGNVILESNPFDELALIRRAKVAPAFLVDTLEHEQEDDRGHVYSSDVGVYTFRLPDGREFKTSTRVPTGDLNQQVEVEYLPDNPTVSRVKGDGSDSLTDWLWRKIGLGSALLAAFCSPGLYLLWKGLNDVRHLYANPEMPVPED